jgi:repressor LexA
MQLHPAQKKLLDILKKNQDEPLTIRYLQELMEASSPSVVHHHITQLEKKGYLRRNPANPYDYQVLTDAHLKDIAFLNVYGMAQCGPKGSMLDGNPIDRIRISSKVLGFPASQAFVVKAKGSSMLPKIKQGDLVIAKKTNTADDGELVVCVNNGEVLIKRLQTIEKGKAYYLSSLNQEIAPFIAGNDFRIEGIVRGVLTYSV